MPAKPTASHAFGWDDIHPRHLLRLLPEDRCTLTPDQALRFTHPGREWLTDRYVSLDVTILDDVPDDPEPPSDTEFDRMPTRAVAPPPGWSATRFSTSSTVCPSSGVLCEVPQ